MKKIFYIFIFCFFSNQSYSDNIQQNKINDLLDKLKNAREYENSIKIESKIWNLWTTHPTDKSLTNLLSDGSYYMSQNNLESAYNIFSKTIELDPSWAEAWNKRATVLYLMGKYKLSQNDIDKVLQLEKRHFGALSGQALIHTALKNYQKAIDSYIEVHKVHPNMKSPLIMIEKLQLKIKKESI